MKNNTTRKPLTPDYNEKNEYSFDKVHLIVGGGFLFSMFLAWISPAVGEVFSIVTTHLSENYKEHLGVASLFTTVFAVFHFTNSKISKKETNNE